MRKTVRLRATITVEWDAITEHYGTDDPKKMAEIDLANGAIEDIIGWGEPIIEITEAL